MWVLIQGLPETSPTWDGRGWGVDQELAAAQVEVTWMVADVLVRAFGGKKAKGLKPLSIPRPHEKKKPKQSAASRLRAFAKTIKGR